MSVRWRNGFRRVRLTAAMVVRRRVLGGVALTLGLVVLAAACVFAAGASAQPLTGPQTAPGAAPTPPTRLALVTPSAYQIFQRDPATGRGTIRITGTYSGGSSPVQASWAGAPWVTVDPHPSGGHFQGAIADRAPGQGTLRVRVAGRPETMVTRSFVGVGDIFVLAGDSNASGRAPTMQRWSSSSFVAAMYGNDLRWQRLRDPVDRTSGQRDRVSTESRPVGGSIWPLLATRLMAGASVPVAMIPVARGGTSMRSWVCKESDRSAPTTLYGNMLRRVRAAGGRVRAVLLWEGPSDAGLLQRTEPEYEAMMRAFTDDVWRDLHAPVSLAQCGEIPYARGTVALDAVRSAGGVAAGWQPQVVPGPQLYDILIHQDSVVDEVHYVTRAAMQTVADRWWAALAGGLYSAGSGRGPRLVRAAYDAAEPAIDLEFAADTLPLVTTGVGGSVFTVHDGAATIAVNAVAQTGPATLRLTLRSAASSPESLSVSLGEGHSGTTGPVPRDGGGWHLPAEWFHEQPVQTPAS